MPVNLSDPVTQMRKEVTSPLCTAGEELLGGKSCWEEKVGWLWEGCCSLETVEGDEVRWGEAGVQGTERRKQPGVRLTPETKVEFEEVEEIQFLFIFRHCRKPECAQVVSLPPTPLQEHQLQNTSLFQSMEHQSRWEPVLPSVQTGDP